MTLAVDLSQLAAVVGGVAAAVGANLADMAAMRAQRQRQAVGDGGDHFLGVRKLVRH